MRMSPEIELGNSVKQSGAEKSLLSSSFNDEMLSTSDQTEQTAAPTVFVTAEPWL